MERDRRDSKLTTFLPLVDEPTDEELAAASDAFALRERERQHRLHPVAHYEEGDPTAANERLEDWADSQRGWPER